MPEVNGSNDAHEEIIGDCLCADVPRGAGLALCSLPSLTLQHPVAFYATEVI